HREAAGGEQAAVAAVVAVGHAVAAPGAEQALALVEDGGIEREHGAMPGVPDHHRAPALLPRGVDRLIHHGREARGFNREVNALRCDLPDLGEHVGFRRVGLGSMPITGMAPAREAAMSALSPMPPVPNTATASPGCTLSTLYTAPMPVGAAQPSSTATSIASPAGSAVRRFSLTTAWR